MQEAVGSYIGRPHIKRHKNLARTRETRIRLATPSHLWTPVNPNKVYEYEVHIDFMSHKRRPQKHSTPPVDRTHSSRH